MTQNPKIIALKKNNQEKNWSRILFYIWICIYSVYGPSKCVKYSWTKKYWNVDYNEQTEVSRSLSWIRKSNEQYIIYNRQPPYLIFGWENVYHDEWITPAELTAVYLCLAKFSMGPETFLFSIVLLWEIFLQKCTALFGIKFEGTYLDGIKSHPVLKNQLKRLTPRPNWVLLDTNRIKSWAELSTQLTSCQMQTETIWSVPVSCKLQRTNPSSSDGDGRQLVTDHVSRLTLLDNRNLVLGFINYGSRLPKGRMLAPG